MEKKLLIALVGLFLRSDAAIPADEVKALPGTQTRTHKYAHTNTSVFD